MITYADNPKQTGLILRGITDEVLRMTVGLPHNVFLERFFSEPKDYHGFQKRRLKDSVAEKMLGHLGFLPGEIQIEIVEVVGDMMAQYHKHKVTCAFVTCLGQEQRFPNPVGAFAVIEEDVFRCHEGGEFFVTPGTPHTFTVLPQIRDAVLWFLSVQFPSIENEESDDFHLIDPPGELI